MATVDRSVVRRAIFLRRIVGECGSVASAGRKPVAQRRGLAAQAREFLGELEHRLVLLAHMVLEVGDLFLEALNALVQRQGVAWCRRPQPP